MSQQAFLDEALAKEALCYTNVGEYLRHKPSGLKVKIITRYMNCIFCEFPKGARVNITTDKLEVWE